MSRLLSFVYGLAAYAACLATLAYFIGFSGNLIVPKSVDSGAEAPWIQALGTNLGLLALFGIQHSVMARRGFKRWWVRVVPSAVERSTYVVATCAALVLLFWLWVPIEAPVVWRVDNRAGAALLWALFGLGWVLVLISTFLIDHFELFGLRQVYAALRERTLPEARFRTPLLYRCVRHPLYAGLMLSLWAVPIMTAGRLLFALGFSAYILIGIVFEERDLLEQFGTRYSHYRAQVGMLLPRLARNGVGASHIARPQGSAMKRFMAVLGFVVVVFLACVVWLGAQTPIPTPPQADMAAASSTAATVPPWPAPQTPSDEPPELPPPSF